MPWCVASVSESLSCGCAQLVSCRVWRLAKPALTALAVYGGGGPSRGRPDRLHDPTPVPRNPLDPCSVAPTTRLLRTFLPPCPAPPAYLFRMIDCACGAQYLFHARRCTLDILQR